MVCQILSVVAIDNASDLTGYMFHRGREALNNPLIIIKIVKGDMKVHFEGGTRTLHPASIWERLPEECS